MFEEIVENPLDVINWLGSVRNCKAFESVNITPFADICIVYPKTMTTEHLSKLIQKYLKVEMKYQTTKTQESQS